MGKVTRKRYAAEFKSRVALKTIRGELRLTELASKHGVHQTMIAQWKRQAIEEMAATFSGKTVSEPSVSSTDVKKLHAKISELLVETPYYGSRQMTWYLRRLGDEVGRKRVRQLMAIIGLQAIYQKPRMSVPHPRHRKYPYLLQDLVIDRPNQA